MEISGCQITENTLFNVFKEAICDRTALSEVGLPQTDIPLALLFFNVGVEAGQLLFVGAYLALGWVFSKIVHTVPSWITPATAYAIGGVSSYWMIARVAAMFRLV